MIKLLDDKGVLLRNVNESTVEVIVAAANSADKANEYILLLWWLSVECMCVFTPCK